MSLLARIKKIEAARGVGRINVAKEMTRLEELVLSGKAPSGKAPPAKTAKDYEKLIKECDNPELVELYRAAIRAIS